jgi:hypothetical protein
MQLLGPQRWVPGKIHIALRKSKTQTRNQYQIQKTHSMKRTNCKIKALNTKKKSKVKNKKKKKLVQKDRRVKFLYRPKEVSNFITLTFLEQLQSK